MDAPQPPPPQHPLSILVVDDDPILRRALARSLQAHSPDRPCHVTECADGHQALAHMTTTPFDCVFLDYLMPGGPDGLEVLRSARAAGVTSPVIVLTGEGNEQLAVQMMKAGATDYLVKGHTPPETLGQTLRHALRLRDAEARVAAAQARARDTEERFRRLVEVAEDGVWILDADGLTTFVNPGAATMLGYRPDEIVGRSPLDFMDPSSRVATLDGLQRRRMGLRERRECLMRHRDGSPVWTIVSASPLHGPDGQYAGSFAVLTDISQEKHTELALRDSEERFRRIFESGPVGMTMTALDRRIIAANAAFGRLVGRDAASLAGTRFDDITHPDDVAHNVDLADRMRAGDLPTYRLDKRYLRPDGSVVWASLTCSLLRDPDGHPYMLSIVEDVTDRRAATEALRESEERFRNVFENGPLGMAIVGLDHRIIAANATLGRMLGHPPDRLVGVAYEQITHPDDLAVDAVQADRLSSGQISSYSIEKRYLRADGAVVWGDLTVSLVRDAAGTPRYAVGMVQDVTQRRHAAAQLQASESRLRTLFESSPVGIAITAGGIVRYVNAAHLRMFGYDRPDELVGRSPLVVVAPASRDTIADRIARRDRGEPVPDAYDAVGIRRDGTQFPYHVRVGRMQLPEGPANVVFTTDTTEENRLREQLSQAQKMESLGRLAGGIAHDFNNLLAVISGYTESLRRRLPDARPGGPAAQQLDEIERAADRGARLVKQLLAFSRSQPVQPQRVDLADAARGVCQMLRQVISRRIELACRSDGAPALVHADPGQIEQMLVNLALNARDAMPDGGTLTFDTRHLDVPAPDADPAQPPGRFVLLSVSDTGVGIDEPTRSRLFEPFFTTKPEGTGLGLAIVYGIVRQQNGHISVHSEPRQGTRFEILLPAAQRAPESSVADLPDPRPL